MNGFKESWTKTSFSSLSGIVVRIANMSVMVNGAAVLEYGNHLPSFHEPPLRFAVRTTIPGKEENDVFVQDSLIPFMPDKNAEVVLIRAPPCPQLNGRSYSGKRKTANHCRTPKRLRRYEESNPRRRRCWVFTRDHNQPVRSRSILNRLPTDSGEEPEFKWFWRHPSRLSWPTNQSNGWRQSPIPGCCPGISKNLNPGSLPRRPRSH